MGKFRRWKKVVHSRAIIAKTDIFRANLLLSLKLITIQSEYIYFYI